VRSGLPIKRDLSLRRRRFVRSTGIRTTTRAPCREEPVGQDPSDYDDRGNGDRNHVSDAPGHGLPLPVRVRRDYLCRSTEASKAVEKNNQKEKPCSLCGSHFLGKRPRGCYCTNWRGPEPKTPIAILEVDYEKAADARRGSAQALRKS